MAFSNGGDAVTKPIQKCIAMHEKAQSIIEFIEDHYQLVEVNDRFMLYKMCVELEKLANATLNECARSDAECGGKLEEILYEALHSSILLMTMVEKVGGEVSRLREFHALGFAAFHVGDLALAACVAAGPPVPA